MLLSRRAIQFLSLPALICYLLVSAAFTQETPPPAEDTQGSAGTLSVNVNVVNIFCNVKDKHGALVPNLQKDDFTIKEDGVPQTLKYFNAETNQPLTLGLLMDTSGSMIDVIPAEKEVLGAFLDQVLKPKDLAFYITFDVDVELLEDFTSSPQRIRRAMERARVNAPPPPRAGVPGIGQGPLPNVPSPGTTLYDAIYLASNDKLSHEVGRKAIVIMSDGVDEGSKTTLNEAIEAAQKADVMCYVLLFTSGIYGGRGEDVMKKLANETGGHLFEVNRRYDKLRESFDEIANELRTQYLLGYTPTNPVKDGTFRRIEIHSKEGYKIQARNGYYAIAHE
jgi:VWFA-related protein